MPRPCWCRRATSSTTPSPSSSTDPDGDPGLAVFERFSASPDQTAWYYRSLLERFARADLPPRLVHRLEVTVDRLAEAAAHAGRA